MKVIDVQGLTKCYGANTVVNDLDISVGKGEISGFLGPNGSGKTTTIRMISGLLIPDGGTGRVLGYDLRSQALEIKRQVGYMTQHFSFYTDLTIQENLEFVARMYRLAPTRERVEKTLDHLGLADRRSQLAGTLSGGWRQRLALAACTMHQPKLLLLDEPTAGVDPKARREFWDEIHSLAESGMTVLVSTHYMDEAERCHRINYISHGRLIASGTVGDVVRQAGLTTFVLAGLDTDKAMRRLKGMTGVEQVAPFGAILHVVGRDREALKASTKAVALDLGLEMSEGVTSLEDIFIEFMNEPGENRR